MITKKVVCFHGTTDKAADQIISTGIWEDSTNNYDWLGKGIYFFQDSPLRALIFAETRCDELVSSGTPASPAVIRAEVSLRGCIDFADARWHPVLRSAYHKYYGLLARGGGRMPEQEPLVPKQNPRPSTVIGKGKRRGARPASTLHYLDRAALDFLVDRLSSTGTTVASKRCAFLDGHPAFHTSWLFDLARIELCVLDKGVIEKNPTKIDISQIELLRDNINNLIHSF